MRLALLHPPLLSPVVWRRLAPLLEEAGHEVATPVVQWSDDARWYSEAARSIVAQVGDADAVLAHSGAGVLVPAVLAALQSGRCAVLVDAVLPPRSGSQAPSAGLQELVSQLAVNDVLPPWTAWWGADALADVVPDDQDRSALVAGAPRLGTEFFRVRVPVPDGWEPAHRGYLQLSPAYDSEAREAGERGWLIERLDGQHLDLLARPDTVARAVLRLLGPAVIDQTEALRP